MNDPIVKTLLHKVADIDGRPSGAFNLRVNGQSIGRANSPGVVITPKKDGAGIDIHIKPGTRGETVHIPVVVHGSGITDIVSNDFYIGDDCSDILIVAGCGIHNSGCSDSRHDGIHRFHIGKNSRVLYKETHYGSGEAQGGKILNPVTDIFLQPGGSFEMESAQLEGVDSTRRVTRGILAADSTLTVTERLMTDGSQFARTEFTLDLEGKGAKAGLISRSVAKGNSVQEFVSRMTGNNDCLGHSECDAIIMDKAIVRAIPEITAAHTDASLIHEAAIGKIAGEQLIKLMTLGLTESEAEAQIINGFLKGGSVS